MSVRIAASHSWLFTRISLSFVIASWLIHCRGISSSSLSLDEASSKGCGGKFGSNKAIILKVGKFSCGKFERFLEKPEEFLVNFDESSERPIGFSEEKSLKSYKKNIGR